MRALDTTDLEILAILFQDARLTNKELASRVGLAPSSCLERVRRLQHDGVIRGSSLRLNVNALGGHIQAMIAARLSNHNRETVEAFMQALLPMPEVLSLYHMGGENDFLIHVTVADTEHLRDFVFNAVTARPEVNHVETALVYDYRFSESLPRF
ncbi:Lrp/AsnC family transcriptional regulator [Bowmanella dokdonensis]|uniref:Lrp/AsnC family transcriptional regulator n=1 Tax=Bowmanella dokdonensis TaxID=751969 RepID=A0A939DJR4_9ALTE|nr:Lrp/AsnC family transcriptional regulator [Bowmanella dokdonensis]MBN7824014.1 Lrp/AsnC family transcriptional regulator [Bowmanella dokdonensis]